MFPEAHAVAAEFLKELNERLGIDLPDSESIALTLHLVNASLPAGAPTEQIVEVLDRILRIVEAQSGLSLNRTSSPVARFTTHMRLLLTRLVTATWATDGLPALGPMLQDQHPAAWACAQKIARLLEVRFGETLPPSELAYVALHVARLTQGREV